MYMDLEIVPDYDWINDYIEAHNVSYGEACRVYYLMNTKEIEWIINEKTLYTNL